MSTDRLLLLLSTLVFLGALVYALRALKKGEWTESRWHWLPMALGFVLQSGFLYLRGQVHGRCPMTSLFEVLVFTGWSVVLLYLVVGAAYRLSLLGAFTAPVVALMQGMALGLLPDPPSPKVAPNPWLETHAALALIAYAAFALACVTGVMHLIQARLLKRHRIQALFHQLPPIQDLARAIRRMATFGLALLTVALLCTLPLETAITSAKLATTWAVWALYAVICFLMWRHVVSARVISWLAVGGFLVPLISLWIVARK
jgi:HemX protein